MHIDRGMDKEDVVCVCVCVYVSVCVYNGILPSHRKEWNKAISSNMDGPRDCHTEWNKSDRKGQISYDITYMRNLKSGSNELIYKKNSHR